MCLCETKYQKGGIATLSDQICKIPGYLLGPDAKLWNPNFQSVFEGSKMGFNYAPSKLPRMAFNYALVGIYLYVHTRTHMYVTIDPIAARAHIPRDHFPCFDKNKAKHAVHNFRACLGLCRWFWSFSTFQLDLFPPVFGLISTHCLSFLGDFCRALHDLRMFTLWCAVFCYSHNFHILMCPLTSYLRRFWVQHCKKLGKAKMLEGTESGGRLFHASPHYPNNFAWNIFRFLLL